MSGTSYSEPPHEIEPLVPAPPAEARRRRASSGPADADYYYSEAQKRGLHFGRVDDLLPRARRDVVSRVPRTFLEKNQLLPLAVENDRLLIVTANADNLGQELARVYGCKKTDTVLVTPMDYHRLWVALDVGGIPNTEEAINDDLFEHEQRLEPRAIALFEAILLDAIAERASDIHFERYHERIRIRLRVDGDLRDLRHYDLTPEEMVSVVNVLKVRSHIDISEKRLPQGGRYQVKVAGTDYDLRVQTQPALHGEHAVVRVLNENSKRLEIEDLGFTRATADRYKRLLDSPSGLLLVVGPTGSGKTTTLYAALELLAKQVFRKVITVEDPIEYNIPQIQQTQVRPEIGFAFSDAMRAFVRQDPDVILVGEIRDKETALEAIRASQTGHLVLSTMHCSDATHVVQRLVDLGIERNSIASELIAVTAQRLAKRICLDCRRPQLPDPRIMAEVFPLGAPKEFSCYVGEGCPRCHGYGSYGRVAVTEYMQVDSVLRSAIAAGPPAHVLRTVARRGEFVSMRESALTLVERGEIALAELRRCLPPDRISGEAD